MSLQQPELARLVSVMHRLRTGCPWDAEQTHSSLVHYLVEETLEVVEAIEVGSDDQLLEELGDLLLQVVFHAEIAAETGRFDIEDVARRIADKLVARHPYVFADAEVPQDLMASWERAKAVEKGRASALDGIPQRMSALSRAHKVIARARSHGLDLRQLGLPEPATSHLAAPGAAAPEASPAEASLPAEALGTELLVLVARAEALGIDPEQAARAALRQLERRVQQVEGGVGP